MLQPWSHRVRYDWVTQLNWYPTLSPKSSYSLLHNWWASLVTQMVKNPPRRWEMGVWSLGLEYPLEEGMATHSSILPGESLLTKGPSSLQSMGSQRVGHHWATFTRIVIASSALAVSSVISNPLLNSASEFKILVLSLFSPCTQWLLGS